MYGEPVQQIPSDTPYCIDGLFVAKSADLRVPGLFTSRPIAAGSFIGFYGDIALTTTYANEVLIEVCDLRRYITDILATGLPPITMIPLRHIGVNTGTYMGYANELPAVTKNMSWTSTMAPQASNNMFQRLVTTQVAGVDGRFEQAVAMFALVDIVANEELFWHYGVARNIRDWAPKWQPGGNSYGSDLRNRFALYDLENRVQAFIDQRMRAGFSGIFPGFSASTVISNRAALDVELGIHGVRYEQLCPERNHTTVNHWAEQYDGVEDESDE